jgi:hypothetical protein
MMTIRGSLAVTFIAYRWDELAKEFAVKARAHRIAGQLDAAERLEICAGQYASMARGARAYREASRSPGLSVHEEITSPGG